MKKKLIALLFSVTVSLLVCEVVLRAVFNIEPGQLAPNQWFKKVDDLREFNGFYADSEGIFKVNADAANTISKRITDYSNGMHEPDSLESRPGEVAEIYSIAKDYTLNFDSSFHNPFSDYLRNIKARAEKSDLDSAILLYSLQPINSDGFKSIPFKSYRTGKKKVLLLGDSFAWGHSAPIKTNGFADLLLTLGYAVYNTGISGADPAQYLAIAKKYIPLLQPDVVIVNFFMGNDIEYFRRELKPGIPIFYATNAGNLYSCSEGVALNSPKEAYELMKASCYLPVENSFFNRLCSTTSVTTLIWRVFNRLGWVQNEQSTKVKAFWESVNKLRMETPYSNIQVDSIRILSEQNKAEFYLVAIPDMQDGPKTVQEVKGLFDGIKYFTAPVKPSGYNLKDGHFNDDGHETYAQFLDSLISSSPN